MKDYKRLTEKDGATRVMSQWAGTSNELKIYRRLAELEDKIAAGTLIEIPGIRKLNIAGMDCVEAVYIQHNGTIGECICLNEAEAEKMLEELKNERV